MPKKDKLKEVEEIIKEETKRVKEEYNKFAGEYAISKPEFELIIDKFIERVLSKIKEIK